MLTSERLIALQTPYLYAEENDQALWGNFTFSTNPAKGSNFSYQAGWSTDLRFNFVMSHALTGAVDGNYRGFGSQDPVFAYVHDFGSVSSASVMYTIGNVQQPIMRYLTNDGVIPLNPWWMHCYGDIFQLIEFHFNDFSQTQQLAAAYEAQLKADVDSYYSGANVWSNNTPSAPYQYTNGTSLGEHYIFDPDSGYGFLDAKNFSGVAVPDVPEAESYYSIVALSARQVMGAYVLSSPPSSGSNNASEPLMFQKEISSDGNVNTVDVSPP